MLCFSVSTTDIMKPCHRPSFSSTTTTTTTTITTTTTTEPYVPSGDPSWNAIRRARSNNNARIELTDLQFIHQLGSGDIGSVYLAELKCARGCMFAVKVMDKEELVSRKKEGRARIEVEILDMLDHPFLPTLYATVDSPRLSCFLTEYCPGGDLHVLRQRQPDKSFHETIVRFYASEVVVALEYLHMMGIIYRDLKPENVLVRSDGHIMLTDFDLSLKNDYSTSTAQIVSHQNFSIVKQFPTSSSSCIVQCFHLKHKYKKQKKSRRESPGIAIEPINVRSMSFVGTHEYLAPEIVSGEGHGNAVDWWTLGIFIFELFYGVTPFKGNDNGLTLANVVARPLEFAKDPSLVSGHAKDLITQLLIKDPSRRMGSTMGAIAIKRHPFFDQVNWALLRCVRPPFIPRCGELVAEDTLIEYY